METKLDCDASGTTGGLPSTQQRPLAGMRILNVCRILWNGGVQRVSIGETIALRKLGVSCDLVFLRSTGNAPYDLPEGTRILSPPGAKSGHGLSRWITRIFGGHRGEQATVDIDLIWQSRTLAKGYDVLLFNDQYAALSGAYLRLTRRQAYVLTWHEFYPKVSRSPWRLLFFPVADAIDAFSLLLAPSIVTTSRKCFNRLERIVPGRTTLARIGFPDPVSPARSRWAARRLVVALTVWDRGRHPEFYLTLASLLPDFQFTLVGVWTDPEHLAAMMEESRTLPNVRITGQVSEEERVSLLNSAGVYTSFGYSESGPGMGGLEAVSLGLVVLANRGIGISELLSDGRNGFIAEPFTLEVAAAKLRRIAALSPAEFDQVAALGQALCSEYSWSEHGKHVLEAARHALAQRG